MWHKIYNYFLQDQLDDLRQSLKAKGLDVGTISFIHYIADRRARRITNSVFAIVLLFLILTIVLCGLIIWN